MDKKSQAFQKLMQEHLAAKQAKAKAQVQSDIDCWTVFEAVAPHYDRILLSGPPGTGKTHGALTQSQLLSEGPVLNMTLTEETPAAELRGHYVFKGGDAVWQDGPATIAFRNGWPLVLNEIDHASADTLSFCIALLDDPNIATIILPNAKGDDGNGEIVQRHQSFRCFATMNGDPDDLPFALRDRFSVSIHIDQPHPNAIAKLPMILQNAARESACLPEERRVSVRAWLAFAAIAAEVGDKLAAAAVFGQRAGDVLTAIKIASKG